MKQYLSTHIASQFRSKDRQRALIDALYSKNQLKLTYDAEMTRNAPQTFAARAGNCLSLVIMTAAFAKEIGVPIRYQMVLGDAVWSRSGGMYFSISHVNLTLGALQGGRIFDNQSAPLTIDFLPGEDIRGQRIRVVTEETIVAMFQCALSPVSDEPVVAAPAIPTLLAIARQRPPAAYISIHVAAPGCERIRFP